MVLHGRMCVKSNITLKLDSDLLRQARILAAQEGSSVSAMLSQRLEELIRKRKEYDEARQDALAQLETGYELHWTPPRTRDELHER